MFEKMRFIGDIHGDLNAWDELIKDQDKTIQVGDFGAGFVPIPDPHDVSLDHKFIRGNHDSPHACRNSSRWISDGTYYPETRMFLMGGAWSIDQAYRTPGVDWWKEEELSYYELDQMIERYKEVRPSIMVTHDCPHSVAMKIFPNIMDIRGSRTSVALDVMFSQHKPDIWIFGHWHEHKNEVVDNTRFLCCDINQAIDINLPVYKGD